MPHIKFEDENWYFVPRTLEDRAILREVFKGWLWFTGDPITFNRLNCAYYV